jgi:hypothetical protein
MLTSPRSKIGSIYHFLSLQQTTMQHRREARLLKKEMMTKTRITNNKLDFDTPCLIYTTYFPS